MTYLEICRETIEDALEQIPEEIKKGNAEEVENFLVPDWLYGLFKQHNHS